MTEVHTTRSSFIQKVGYDSASGNLMLTMNGKDYEYKDVPEEKYQEMLNAESIGKYFIANIKGKYQEEKK